MKKFLCLLVLTTCFLATDAFAADLPAKDLEVLEKAHHDSALTVTRLMVDLHLSYFERNAVRLQDLRVSPIIRAENHFEVPVEMGFSLTENQIPLTLRGFEESSGGKMTATPRAITISVSAESSADGRPFLAMTILTSFSSNTGNKYDNSLKNAIEALSKTTSFSPLIRRVIVLPPGKKAESTATASSGSWITNMRIDSDKRLQITGYATDALLVNQLCRELEKTGAFSELWLSNMTRNVYEKHPVMRFDISGKIISAPEN